MTELPAAEFAGFLWVALDPGATLDVAAHLGPLADELDSWGIGRWSPLGEKVLDFPINWKLAVDTFAENYHFATVHRQTFATIARSNCTVFDSYGPHHRLIFPLNTILELDECSRGAVGPVPQHGRDLRAVPQHRAVGDDRQRRAVPDLPGRPNPARSITVHQNSTPLDLSDESVAAGAQAVFEYAHATVRDEDYRLVEGLQANLESGARDHLVFGRNEPGLQHRHITWARPSPGTVRAEAVNGGKSPSETCKITGSARGSSIPLGQHGDQIVENGCQRPVLRWAAAPVSSSTASPRRPAATSGTT